MPRTTAAMLEADYQYRTGGPLAPALRGRLRWTAAHAIGCRYSEQVAIADMRLAGQSADVTFDATDGTSRRDVPEPVPIFVVYETAFADADGKLQFRPDVYGRDAEIWQSLDPKGRAVAEREPPVVGDRSLALGR